MPFWEDTRNELKLQVLMNVRDLIVTDSHNKRIVVQYIQKGYTMVPLTRRVIDSQTIDELTKHTGLYRIESALDIDIHDATFWQEGKLHIQLPRPW